MGHHSLTVQYICVFLPTFSSLSRAHKLESGYSNVSPHAHGDQIHLRRRRISVQYFFLLKHTSTIASLQLVVMQKSKLSIKVFHP